MLRNYRSLVNRVLVVMFFLFLGATVIRAEDELPLPDGVEMVRNNDFGSAQAPSQMRIYKSDLPVAKLNDFFMKSMKGAGWEGTKEKDGALMFKKEQEIVMVVAIPPREAGLPTQFSITKMKTLSEKDFTASKKDVPDKLSFMPIYPKSKQLFLIDMPSGGVSASYSTDDNIQDIEFFYKAQMLSYGWQLSSEEPITEESMDCPTCKKNLLPNGQKIPEGALKGTTKKSSLTFSRNNGEICVIRAYSQEMDISSAQMSAGAGKSTILVTYVESKIR